MDRTEDVRWEEVASRTLQMKGSTKHCSDTKSIVYRSSIFERAFRIALYIPYTFYTRVTFEGILGKAVQNAPRFNFLLFRKFKLNCNI